MIKIVVTATPKPQSLIDRIVRNKIIVGHQFKIKYKITSLEDIFVGRIRFEVKFSSVGLRTYHESLVLPQTAKKEVEFLSPPIEMLCSGYALVTINIEETRKMNGWTDITFYNEHGRQVTNSEQAIKGILGCETQEIYSYLAMLATTGSLLFLVAEKIYTLLRS